MIENGECDTIETARQILPRIGKVIRILVVANLFVDDGEAIPR
jgi:hypothetical protein